VGPEGQLPGGESYWDHYYYWPGGTHQCWEQREETVLQVLQGEFQLIDDNPWLQKICFPSDDFSWPSFILCQTQIFTFWTWLLHTWTATKHLTVVDAVKHMLSLTDESRITLVHGPQALVKTTVIATYVHFGISRGQRGIWLTAQSNVAVKNIAEKLSDSGFTNWKLIVSKDFHEWLVCSFQMVYGSSLLMAVLRHEHLYSKISRQSQSFWMNFFQQGLRKALNGVRVILCTLSMLSNPGLVSISRSNSS